MNFRRWTDGIKSRVRQDKNCLIIITGNVRMGKSTLAKRLAAVLDETFKADQVAFTGRQLREIAVGLEPYKVTYMDESVEGGFSRDAMAKTNKDLNKFMIVWGTRNLIGFLLIPHLKDLDSGLERRADYMVKVPHRGKAVVYRPTRGDFTGKTFWGPEGGWFSFPFKKVERSEDPVWDEIERRKDAMVQKIGEDPGASVDGPQYGPTTEDVDLLIPVIRPLLERHGLRCRQEA